MKQYYIICDVSLCHDCNDCLMACMDEHVDNEWLPYSGPQPRHGHRWIDILRKERGQYPRIDVAYLPLPCQHCADTPCARDNPGCIVRREDGVVLIDTDNAAGNKVLVGSCPYGAIYWNDDRNIAQKCTMCAHILDGGSWERKTPRCVHSCPTGALEFHHIEPDEMEKKILDENLMRYRPEAGGSKGGVYYRNLHRYEKLFIAGGLLRGGECAEGVEVSLEGGGVCMSQVSDEFGDFKFDGLEPGEYTISIDGAAQMTVTALESLNLGSIIVAE